MTHDAKELIDTAEEERNRIYEYVRPAAEWFHDTEGELHTREDAVASLSDELDIENDTANVVIGELVGDKVDPVVQVMAQGEKYVGVVEYVEGDAWYGYLDFDDVRGQFKRVVSAIDVQEKELDREIRYAAEGEGTFSDEDEVTYDDLAGAVEAYHEEAYPDVDYTEVETGASLTSGTTIGGNTAWHSGNDGGGSGLAADTLDGNHASAFASSGHGHSQLHNKYTDSEARSAVNGSNININGDSDTVDGYHIQKNGSDGSGIINFKT